MRFWWPPRQNASSVSTLCQSWPSCRAGICVRARTAGLCCRRVPCAGLLYTKPRASLASHFHHVCTSMHTIAVVCIRLQHKDVKHKLAFCGKNARMQECTAKVSALLLSFLQLNSQYSARGSYSKSNSAGKQFTFLCRGLVGEHCKGTRKMPLHLTFAKDMPSMTPQWIAAIPRDIWGLSPITTRRRMPSTLSSLSSDDGDALAEDHFYILMYPHHFV